MSRLLLPMEPLIIINASVWSEPPLVWSPSVIILPTALCDHQLITAFSSCTALIKNPPRSCQLLRIARCKRYPPSHLWHSPCHPITISFAHFSSAFSSYPKTLSHQLPLWSFSCVVMVKVMIRLPSELKLSWNWIGIRNLESVKKCIVWVFQISFGF